MFVLNRMTIESNNDCQILSCTPGSAATAVTELPFAMHLAGRKARRRNQGAERHSATVPVELLDRRILLVTEQRFATPAVEPSRLRAPTGIAPRFDRRVAAVWGLQVSLRIKLRSEMQVVARRVQHLIVVTEQHFEIVLGGRRDLRAVIGNNSKQTFTRHPSQG